MVRRGRGVACPVLLCIVGLLWLIEESTSQTLNPQKSRLFFENCLDDLTTADDGDSILKTDEYVIFIGLRSDGRLNYTDYSDMPLSLVSNFNFGACFCALVSTDEQCCVGPDAGVILDTSVSEFVEDNLSTFCKTVDEAVGPLLVETPGPTVSPSLSPSSLPSSVPATAPTVSPSGLPSSTPTDFPSASPTTPSPSATPTAILTEEPSPLPSQLPTSSPTEPTFRPTSENELCIDFQYGIINNGGVDADEIFNMENNTLKTGLIIATTNVTIETLNASFPENERLLRYRQRADGETMVTTRTREFGIPGRKSHLIVPLSFFGSHLPSGVAIEAEGTAPSDRGLVYVPQNWYSTSKTQFTRRLVFYLDEVPPVILAVINNPFCPTETPEVTRCAIVTSTVCVFLQADDDPTTVRTELRRGIQASIANGEFEDAIPDQNRIEDLTL